MIELLNTHADTWLRTFGLAVGQNTLFLAVVLLVLYWMRHAPARVRYIVGAIGLVKLLLPPFIPAHLVTASSGTLDALAGSAVMIPLGGLGVGSEVAPSSSTPLSLPGLLFGIWLAAALGFLLLSGLSTWRLWWLLRDAVPIDAGGILPRFGIRLYRSPRLNMPMCFGVRPRRIFVPAVWDEWTLDRRRMIVRHELAHIERRDGLFQMLQILAQALYLFHPLVWILNRRLREYREMACDDASTNSSETSRLEYSRHLVEIAETLVHDPLPHHPASALFRTRNELRQRITYQLKEGSMSPISRKALITIVTILVALALPLSWYQGGTVPGASVAASPQMSGHTIIELTLTSDEDVRVDGEQVAIDDLDQTLEAMSGSDRERIVVQIGCEEDVTMGALFRVQQTLRALELTKVNYLTEQGKGLALVLPPIDPGQPIPAQHLARLTVPASGEVRLDGNPIEVAGIWKEIERLLATDDNLVVAIDASNSTRYHDFIAVLGQVKAAGAPRIMVDGPDA